jgi:hypothetical protein
LDQDLTNWPLAQIPTTKLPNEKTPNEKTPTEKIPTEKRPAEKIPAENKPADKTPELKSPADNHPDADSPGGAALGKGGAIRPMSNNGINVPQIIICAILCVIITPPSTILARPVWFNARFRSAIKFALLIDNLIPF